MGAFLHNEVEGSKERCFPNVCSWGKIVGKPFGCGITCKVMMWSQTSGLLSIPGTLWCRCSWIPRRPSVQMFFNTFRECQGGGKNRQLCLRLEDVKCWNPVFDAADRLSVDAWVTCQFGWECVETDQVGHMRDIFTNTNTQYVSFQGLHNKAPYPGWLKATETYRSLFWRPEVPSQSVGMLFQSLLRKILLYLSQRLVAPALPPVSASVFI